MHITVADLRLFICIAEAENLTRGAKSAFLSPSAASGRLKALEEQLQNRLFYRESTGLKLAPAGHVLLRHARIILSQIEYLKSDIMKFSGDDGGHVRIFANTTAVTEFMPNILAEFLADRPKLTIDIEEKATKAIINGVREGAADLGIAAGPVATSGLQALHFSTDRLVLATCRDHPLAAAGQVSFVDTIDLEHISLHEGSTLQTFVRAQSEERGKKLTVRVQVRGFESMCRMIEAGVGVGILPESAAVRHRQTMQIAIVGLTDPWAVRERYVLVRDLDTLPGCTQSLIQAIRDHAS